MAFRRAHITNSVISLKKKEFRAIKQGRHTVQEYLWDFDRLSHYALVDVADDREKHVTFMNGLSEEMQDKLIRHTFADFRMLVDKAILSEDKGLALATTRKRS